jgi:hypothetical protein
MFMGATDEEMHKADNLGVDHVTYALFVRPLFAHCLRFSDPVVALSEVFSMSFVIFLHITFLVHLYSNSGRNKGVAEEATAKEEGYEALQLDQSQTRPTQDFEAESFELTDRHSDDGDPVDLTGKDEIDWMRSAR